MARALSILTRAGRAQAPWSAGALARPIPFLLPEHLTIGQAMEEVRRAARAGPASAAEAHVYATDAAGRLAGAIPLRTLVLSRPEVRLSEVLDRRVTTVSPDAHREEAARLLDRRGVVSVPVVADDGRPLGILTVDDAIDVLAQEAGEDVRRLFGVGAEERLDTPWHASFRARAPWLLVNLVLAAAGAAVIAAFQDTVAALVVLTVYLPVVAGMGGNASAQAMAVAVRGLAVEGAAAAGRRSFLRTLAREARVGLTTGGVIGALAAGVAWAAHLEHGLVLGMLVGLALLANHVVGCLWGAALPFLMRWLGLDPAQSATVFTTTLTDLVGFLLLLAGASVWLARQGG